MDWKATAYLRSFSLLKAPLIAFLGPIVERLDEEECRVRIPTRFRSRNPMGSMYLGALATGADVTGGLMAYHATRQRKANVSILFTAMDAKFVKKGLKDVVFVCRDTKVVAEAIDETIASGEGVARPVLVLAYSRGAETEAPIAEFRFTLAVKARQKK